MNPRNMLAMLACGLTVACASSPQPEVMRRASSQLVDGKTDVIEATQPRLIREAREYEREAREAFERGDLERAELLAHLSIQRYRTADAFTTRRAQEELQRLMVKADSTLDEEAARVARESRELARYDDLAARFEQTSTQLDTMQQDQRSLATRAQRALSRARALQAESIGVGGPSVTPQIYGRARVLVEGALDAYDSGLFEDSLARADEAIEQFEISIKEAQDSAVAARRAPDGSSEDTQEDTSAPTPAAGTDAPAATSAEVKPAAPEAARPDDTSSARRGEAIRELQQAEDARAAAIRRGVAGDDLREGDYALTLARDSIDRDQLPRAIQKAGEARRLFESRSAAAPAAVELPRAEVVSLDSAPSSSSTSLRERSEERIVALQLARANALNTQLAEGCPGTFESFDALLELSRQRWDARDDEQAFEFAVRAQARLEECEGARARRGSSADSAKIAELQFKRDREIQDARDARSQKIEEQEALASTSLIKAQVRLARLTSDHPGDPRLRESATLLAQAERWFEQTSYIQALGLADAALESADAFEAELEEERKAASAQEAREAAEAAEARDEAAAEQPVGATPPRSACEDRATWLARLELSRDRAQGLELSAGEGTRLTRAIDMTRRVGALAEAGDCETASMLAKEAEYILGSIQERAAVAATAPDVSVAVETPSGPGDTDTTRKEVGSRSKALDAIARARIMRAKSSAQSGSDVYATASDLLDEAQRAVESGRHDVALGLANQASGALSSLAEAGDERARTAELEWKPAYSKVLEALIRRDEVALTIGEPEQERFDLGAANLERSRAAWSSKDFMGAGRFADAARADFDAARSAAKKRAEQEKIDAAAKAKADAARDASARTRAQQEAAAAKEAAAREAAARKAAQEEASAREAAAEAEAARADAQRLLDEANLQARLCERRACTRRDGELDLRARASLDSSRAALEAGDFARASRTASESLELFEQVLALPLPFTISADSSRITRVGDRLVLSPRIEFVSGKALMTADSLVSIQQLAVVLQANAGVLSRVELDGYSDSRGSVDTNTVLSKRRAEAVRDRLVTLGVSGDLLEARGFGPERPVADNKTSKGRAANRRVEIHIKTKDKP